MLTNDRLRRLAALLEAASASLVLARPIDDSDYVVLLRQMSGPATFAACRVSTASEVISAPNYRDDSMDALILAAPISPVGLQELAAWTDHATALHRFGDIAMRAGVPHERLSLVRD